MAWETLRTKAGESIDEERLYENVLSIQVAKGPTLSCQDIVDMDTGLAARVDRLPVGSGREAETDVIHHRSGEIPLRQCTVKPLHDLKSHNAIQQVAFAYERHVPKLRHVDVLVAGGGTAGAMAAIAAVEQGANVSVVEYFPELGGTKTVGGVVGWYAGHRETELFQIFGELSASVQNFGFFRRRGWPAAVRVRWGWQRWAVLAVRGGPWPATGVSMGPRRKS